MSEGRAIVIGASGGIGAALADVLEARGAQVLRLSRGSDPRIDLLDEASIAAAAAHAAQLGDIDLILDATGFLHNEQIRPEKALRDLDPAALAHNFAINAIGPALLMKHFLPLLPRTGRSVFATLSAKVGSIGDNHLGGWHGYRAAKAALNQLVRTASIELARRAPEALCVALHPGTVETPLSAPFAKSGLDVRPPALAAAQLLDALDGLSSADSGGFFSYDGSRLPW